MDILIDQSNHIGTVTGYLMIPKIDCRYQVNNNNPRRIPTSQPWVNPENMPKGDFLKNEIQKFVTRKNWTLQKDYHFGGYAKYNDELIRFINWFSKKTQIQLDPIYTGKMIFGILDLIQKDAFAKGTKILAIHTGGLQGIVGVNQKLTDKNKETITII